jgi:hypothetical protein
MEKVLNFGKNQGKTVSQCEPSYILWLSQHKAVLHTDNQWAADEAFKILTSPSREAQICLQQINTMNKCLFFAKYEYEKSKYQKELNNRISYLKSNYGYSVQEKHHEYIFA